MAEIEYISYSGIQNWNQCPWAYRESRKMNRDLTEMVAPEYFSFGKFLHKIMELTIGTNKDPLQVAKEIFIEYKITPERFMEAREIIRKVIDTRDYFKVDKKQILSKEKEFKIILPNGVAIRGFIDLVVERDKDTVEIIDFKSGSNNWVSEFQMEVYALAIKQIKEFEGYKNVLVTIDFLKFDPLHWNSKLHDDQGILHYLESVYKDITTNKNPQCKINAFCHTCPVINKCKLIKKLIDADIFIPNELNEETKVDFFKRYQELNVKKKIIMKREGEAKDIIKAWLGSRDEMVVGDLRVTFKKNRLMVKENKDG